MLNLVSMFRETILAVAVLLLSTNISAQHKRIHLGLDGEEIRPAFQHGGLDMITCKSKQSKNHR